MCTARVSKWLPWELSSVLPSDSCSQRSRGFDGIVKALLKIPRARAWESVLVGGNRRQSPGSVARQGRDCQWCGFQLLKRKPPAGENSPLLF